MHENRYAPGDPEQHIREYEHRRGVFEGFNPEDEGFRSWSKQKAEMYSQPQRQGFGEFIRKKGFNLG